MLSPNAKAFYGQPSLRVAATVAGTFVLLLLLAILRPEMMGMTMLYRLMSTAAGL